MGQFGSKTIPALHHLPRILNSLLGDRSICRWFVWFWTNRVGNNLPSALIKLIQWQQNDSCCSVRIFSPWLGQGMVPGSGQKTGRSTKHYGLFRTGGAVVSKRKGTKGGSPSGYFHTFHSFSFCQTGCEWFKITSIKGIRPVPNAEYIS